MAYEKESINEMKLDIIESIRHQLNYSWSLEQIKPLFEEAVRQALEELQKTY